MDEIVRRVDPPPSTTGSNDRPGSLKESQDRELRVRLSAESLENMKTGDRNP